MERLSEGEVVRRRDCLDGFGEGPWPLPERIELQRIDVQRWRATCKDALEGMDGSSAPSPQSPEPSWSFEIA
jgi:hypothetical protein